MPSGPGGRRLPSAVRVECKFTTGSSVALPRRELEALEVHEKGAVGVIAVLFWNGTPDPNGRWLLVDAKEAVRPGGAACASFAERDLVRLDRTQRWLNGLRQHAAENWRPFLAAFVELSRSGHDALRAELRELHDSGNLRAQVDRHRDDVLEVDHRASVQAIVDELGESVAGHVFQDLLAYLLGMAGYRTVRMNAVGVPDIELTDLAGGGRDERISVSLSRDELERALALAQAADDTTLLDALRGSICRGRKR